MSENNNNLGSLLDEDLKIIVCGDWCMNGKVEGGFLSAKDAVNKLLKYI
jgi:predicted NAD/FAD-dependent oxidoreductase